MKKFPLVPGYVRHYFSHATLRGLHVSGLLHSRELLAKNRPSMFIGGTAARRAAVLAAYDKFDARINYYLLKAERREYLSLF